MIGGLKPCFNWNTPGEIEANILGWGTSSFPELQIILHREMDATAKLMKIDASRGAYFLGYHPLFMIVNSMTLITKRPYFLGALALLYGFFISYLKDLPKVDASELIQYLRRQQINKIFFRETIWK